MRWQAAQLQIETRCMALVDMHRDHLGVSHAAVDEVAAQQNLEFVELALRIGRRRITGARRASFCQTVLPLRTLFT